MRLLKRSGLFDPKGVQAKLTRAVTLESLDEAYRLGHDVFVECGYIRPLPGGLRVRAYEALPDTATFIGLVDGKVAGIQSLIVDSEDLGLPSDDAFKQDIDTLRSGGRLVCEVANQAIAADHRRTGLSTELMRCCFAHAQSIGCDELITTVSPGHARFYELLGFEKKSSVRSFSDEIDDPTVVVGMDLTALNERFRGVTKDDGTVESFLNSYYIQDNPYHRHVGTWQVVAERLFRDSTMLCELFVTRSGLLDRCSESELEAIRRRWGAEVFDSLYTATAFAAPLRVSA